MLFTSLSCLFLLQIVSNVHGSSLPSHLPQYYFQDSQTTHLLLSSSLNTAALNVVSLDEQHQTAINYFKQSIGVTSDTGYRVDRSWRDNEGIFHAYISPMLEGIEVENAQAAIHVDKFGRVSSMSHSWISPSASSSSSSLSPRLSVQSVVVGGGDGGEDDVNDDDVDLTASSPITPQQAYTLASTAINKNNPVVSGDYPSLKDSVAVKYYRRRDGGLERAYEFMIPSSTHLYQVFVSISTGEILAVSDWAGSNFVPDRLLKRQRTSPIIASSSSSSSSTTTTMSSPRRRNLRDASQRRQVLNRRENNTPISTTYRVVPLTANSPDVATSILINPANKEASPLGWHDTGIKSMKNGNTPTLTQGNNVVAVEMMTNRARSLTDLSNVAGLRAEGKKSKSCSSGGGGDGCEEKIMFEFPIDQRGIAPAKLQQGNATKSTASSSFQAGVVNVFYLANTVHDILYLYGFDEAAGNFQMNNFNKGAIIGDSNVKNKEDTSPSSSPSAGGNDAVFATVYDVAQDQAGAQFIFHPDGTPGEMRVGTFKSDDGNIKDVALEDDVVLHELFHGVVYRLVGGASQGNCLTSAEADGLNEGWADYFAWAMTMPSQNTKASSTLKKTWTIPDRFMGVFISGKREGMRNHPYSTDMKRNPYTYASLHDPELLKSGDGKTLVFPEAHDAGEVWSEMLYEVYWAMVSKYGMEPNYANSKSTSGNILLLRIVMQSLKTVKCNPTFVRARDAMLEADANIFQGKHSCDLWRGFAKRGLGAGVKETKDMQFKNDFSLPQQCSK